MSAGGRRSLLWAVILVLIVGLRMVALRSDPYTRLDWSAGLLTDEGFYVHNARNVALFGRARTDDFNNMLLSPFLHAVQVVVFRTFGVGAVQARLISVLCSLLALWLFWVALRRAFDNRIAVTATLFLGLDHTNLLYNRMALMDTPAQMGAVAAFYAFVRSVTTDDRRWTTAWVALCGALIGLTVANRTLCLYLLPVPALALLPAFRGKGREAMRRVAALTLPMLTVFALYLVMWHQPHRAEIARMTHYYRTEQVQPSSLMHLLQNVQHAVLGDFRGLSPYLFRHTPVLFALALLGLAGRSVARRKAQDAGKDPETRGFATCDSRLTTNDSPVARYLILWLLLGWAMLAVISYSPSRYYVTTYPALAGVAALTLWRLPEVWAALWSGARRARAARGALAWFLAYHAVETFAHHGGVLPRLPTLLLLYGAPTLVATGVVLGRGRTRTITEAQKHRDGTEGSGRDDGHPVTRSPGHLVTAVGVLWLAANVYWLGDWALRMRWTQYETSRWLARNLPKESVLLGDVSPGVSMDNPFVAVNVIPGLSNDDRPVERFAGRPRYIVILDRRVKGALQEPWWRKTYPALTATPRHRLRQFRVLRWTVGLYAVPPEFEKSDIEKGA